MFILVTQLKNSPSERFPPYSSSTGTPSLHPKERCSHRRRSWWKSDLSVDDIAPRWFRWASRWTLFLYQSDWTGGRRVCERSHLRCERKSLGMVKDQTRDYLAVINMSSWVGWHVMARMLSYTPDNVKKKIRFRFERDITSWSTYWIGASWVNASIGGPSVAISYFKTTLEDPPLDMC